MLTAQITALHASLALPSAQLVPKHLLYKLTEPAVAIQLPKHWLAVDAPHLLPALSANLILGLMSARIVLQIATLALHSQVSAINVCRHSLSIPLQIHALVLLNSTKHRKISVLPVLRTVQHVLTRLVLALDVSTHFQEIHPLLANAAVSLSNRHSSMDSVCN